MEDQMPVDCHIFVTISEPLSQDERGCLEADLAEALGEDSLLTYDGHHALRPFKKEDYKAELPDGLPHSECILRCALCTPYYGPGYERGYWPVIAAAIEYLRRRCPEGKVWYGRDDGDWVREVSSQYLDEVWDHWAINGSRPYYTRA